MIITNAQERVMDVYDRALTELPKEIIEINVAGPIEERIILYKAIETDFNSYSTLGNDVIQEVKTNLSSNLRPAETTKYISNLNSYVFELIEGYEFIESDEWIDKIFVEFSRLRINPNIPKPQLTEDDKKFIFEVAEEVRSCCYEYAKAADAVASIIHPLLTGYGIMPLKRTVSSVLPPQNSKPNTTFKPVITSTNPVPANTSTPKDQNSEQESPHIQTVEPNTKLHWRDNRGEKTDIAELAWALAKSQRIIDNATGKPVTLDVLARQLGSLFGTSISNPMQLMQARKDSYKASEDGFSFISSLSELVEQYIGSK